jgi:hypothetical protein
VTAPTARGYRPLPPTPPEEVYVATATPTATTSDRAIRKEAKRLQKLSVDLFFGLLNLEGEIRRQGGDARYHEMTLGSPQSIINMLTEVIHPNVFRVKLRRKSGIKS